MNVKRSLKNLKNILHPNKTENLLILEVCILAILIYYDVFFEFPIDYNIPIFLITLLSIYILFLVVFYIMQRIKISDFGFQNQFYLFTQTIFSAFFGIIICVAYFFLNTNQTFTYLISLVPLAFLILIVLFQKITQLRIEKFIKRYIIKDEIWNRLDEQTKKDFKHAETSMRAENIPNAIMNITKGLERELKLSIFQPFKFEVKKYALQEELFQINRPFKSDGSDPRYRTYLNFKNYISDKRHLTLGNIPFFLLNLTDKKIGIHTDLFSKFSAFLQEKFEENYSSIIEISKILFNHDFFTIPGIKISDLRNEAAHPQKKIDENGNLIPTKSNEILSIDNYITMLKILTVQPNLLKLIIDLKD
jgi:hypothetical protein